MSRTYRRKNYESTKNSSWDTEGFKLAGYYTMRRSGSHRYDNGTERGGFAWYVWYEKPTIAEYNKERLRIHGESPRNWDPDRLLESIKKHRMRTKQELIRFKKNPDNYEPIVEESSRKDFWY